jgi:hypothetical protein
MTRILAAVLLINALALVLLLPTVNAMGSGAGSLARGPLLAALGGAVVFSPLVALLKAAVLSAIIWATAAACDVPIPLWAALRPALVAEIALALAGPWTAIVLLARGAPATPADLAVPTGVNAFLALPAGWPTLLAEQLGLFHLLWAVALGLLLRQVLRASPRTITLAVLACWLTGFGGALIRANLAA